MTTVALPEIPEGYRWVIDRNCYDGWAETRVLGIHLQKYRKGFFAKWKDVEARKLSPEYMYSESRIETLAECAERISESIKDNHIKVLKKKLEEESIIGVYEQGTKQALP